MVWLVHVMVQAAQCADKEGRKCAAEAMSVAS